MKLESFRVRNYRSINDSGEISASRITALLGRNESGKSNLLRALHSLNPIEGFAALKPIKDFPRHRRLEECTDETPVLSTTWVLDDDEKEALLEVLPRATEVKKVTIGRNYQGKTRHVAFPDLKAITFDEVDVKSKVKKVSAAMRAVAQKQEDPTKLNAAADAFETVVSATRQRDAWAAQAVEAAKSLRTALAGADAELTGKQEEVLSELEELADRIVGDKDALHKARNWPLERFPSLSTSTSTRSLVGTKTSQPTFSESPRASTPTRISTSRSYARLRGLSQMIFRIFSQKAITKHETSLQIEPARL